MPVWLLIFVVFWIAFALACGWLARTPRPGAPLIGLVYRLTQIHVHWVHRLTVRGAEHVPPGQVGSLIVVCNHTSGIDASLVQSACEFEIRWMMAKDMMLEKHAWVWEMLRIIPVDRASVRDTGSAREAIRHVQSGGVVGVFPEGGIESPPGRLLPFKAGVGLLVVKTGAAVLPVWIDGTPTGERAWDSLWRTSRSRVMFGPIMRFQRGARADQVTREVQQWFEKVSQWPVAEKPRVYAAHREGGEEGLAT